MKKFFLILLLLFSLSYQTLSQELKSQYSTISGTISEEKSGEVIIGVTIALYSDNTEQVKKTVRGTYTNKFGFFSIPNINPGKYKIKVSGVGYKTYEKDTSLLFPTDIHLNIQLTQVDIRLKDVVIEEQRTMNPVDEISTIKVPIDFILKMPSLGGEKDIFRTLQLLPGVKQASELSSGLYIRGGSPDQNLILLDGVIVYNPDHLGGFLSTFNSDALRDVKLIKGAFPAEYGGRISSVIDMTMKEGTKEKFSGAGGISLINSRLTLQGPINDNCTFMISGRRMYLDLILGLIPDTEDAPDYYFYDLNAKVNYKISETDRVFLSGFFGKDVLTTPPDEETSADINWGNSTANLRWMHIVSPDLFTNFSLIYTDYKFSAYIYENENELNNFTTLSKIQDLMFRTEAQYFPIEDHTFKAGLESIWHNFKSGASVDFITEDVLDILGTKKLSSMETSLYFQDEWKITPLLSSNLGGRFFYFQKGNYFRFEPRLSASYSIDDKTSLKGSFAIANQFLHFIVRNDITLPTDLWFPSTESIKPSVSSQGILGVETTLNNGEYFVSAEVYYKDMRNLYEYRDTAKFTLGIPIESDFTTGRGEAYGFELFINKRLGSFTGWLGYTLSWTKRFFNELNEGKPFYPRYDRRHDISLVLTYELNESFELSASWVYGTGQAYTVPTGQYSFSPVGFDVYLSGSNWSNYYSSPQNKYSERNGCRLPAFHKLDINFMYKYKWFDIPFELSVNVYNAYNHKNPFAWYIGSKYDPTTKTSKRVVKQFTLFPIIPSLGLSFKF